jgi:hypothetical protein
MFLVPSTSPAPSELRGVHWLADVLFCFVASVAATSAVGAAARLSLGLVWGGLFAAAILIPPLLSVAGESTSRLGIFVAGVAGVSLVWLSLIGPSRATFGQWVMLVALLTSLLTLLAGLVMSLRSFQVAPALAAAIVTTFAILWLTWPIWLSTYLGSGESRWLVALHPPLAANGLLTFTVPWTEQAIAYQLTVLNQDVPIRLPTNPIACILVHAMSGAALIVLACIRERSGP